MHILFLSIIMGLALAMPVGPVTIAMSQRTLKFGASQGITIGLGASSADLLYMLALLLGIIQILQHAILLHIVGILGALVLCWFAYQAITSHPSNKNNKVSAKSLFACYKNGFLIAALSPFSILFWASMAAQLANLTHNTWSGAALAMLGLLIGLMGWVISFNSMLHITRHRLSETAMLWLNRIGGVLLFLFAFYSLWRIFQF